MGALPSTSGQQMSISVNMKDTQETLALVGESIDGYRTNCKLDCKNELMVGFTKLFHSITTSSIWNEDDKTRLVWVTMLALCDPDGVVRASIGGLAHASRVSKEDCQRAIDLLLSPDTDSRSEQFEGRRIEKVDGGFYVLNYLKYRECRDEKDRKEYMREYMREYRKQGKLSVSDSKQSKHKLAKEEEGDEEAEAKADQKKRAFTLPHPTARFEEAWKEWLSYRSERRLTNTDRTLKAQLFVLGTMTEDEAISSINSSITQGWQGLFPAKHNGVSRNGKTATPHTPGTGF